MGNILKQPTCSSGTLPVEACGFYAAAAARPGWRVLGWGVLPWAPFPSLVARWLSWAEPRTVFKGKPQNFCSEKRFSHIKSTWQTSICNTIYYPEASIPSYFT